MSSPCTFSSRLTLEVRLVHTRMAHSCTLSLKVCLDFGGLSRNAPSRTGVSGLYLEVISSGYIDDSDENRLG